MASFVITTGGASRAVTVNEGRGPAGPAGATGAQGPAGAAGAAGEVQGDGTGIDNALAFRQVLNVPKLTGGSVSQGMRAGVESRTPRIHIAFVDDDSPANTYDVLYPILSNDSAAITALGLTPGTYDAVPGVAAVITGTTGNAFQGALTVAEALELEAAGWEIASHSTVAGSLTSETLSTAEDRLSTSRQRLIDLGFAEPQTIVWPNGGNNADLRAIAAKYFRGGRGVGSHIVNCRNIAPFAQMDFAGYPLGAYFGTDGSNTIDSLAEYQAIIDRALEHDLGEFICFMLHTGDVQFDDTQRQALIDLIEWIQAKPEYSSGDIVFSTCATAMDEMETTVSGGMASGTVDTPRMGRRDIDPAAAGCWALSRNGTPYLPNVGNLVKLAQNAVTPSTSITSFSTYQVTYCPILNDGESWPVRDDGTLTTHRPAADATLSWQEWKPLGDNRTFLRYWNGSAWTTWVVRDTEIGIRRVASKSESLTYGVLAAGARVTKAVSFSGIATLATGTTTTVPGDHVMVTPARHLEAGLVYDAFVYDANTVQFNIHNVSTGSITPATRNWRFDIIRNQNLYAEL